MLGLIKLLINVISNSSGHEFTRFDQSLLFHGMKWNLSERRVGALLFPNGN